jgi:hypothetical protein
MALPSAASADIPAGDDLFETSPQDTTINFGGMPLPPGFFDPGSDPFTGVVRFGGEYLGPTTGDADTIISRLAPAMLGPAFPDMAMVPIEIVALHLVSIEPITVSYGGANPEPWDITVGLQQVQAPGQMEITQESAQGGHFNTLNLPVNVVLTFTRLSDGATRTQNMGVPAFQSNGSPWRAGCVPPALVISTTNVFCPGLTPGGQKQLTVEQFALATHGVLPAQPRLEHFQCYVTARLPFNRRRVGLKDQFASRRAGIRGRAELCNPTKKLAEPFLNRAAHLQCYTTRGPAVNRTVAVRNQFGSQRLLVGRPLRLCLPSRKNRPGRAAPQIKPAQRIDHFQCYGVQAVTPLRRRGALGVYGLKDQFGKRKVRIGPSFRLCAPVQKNTGLVQHPVRHLVCYGLRMSRRSRVAPYQYGIKNQFERNPALRTVKRQSLCVPSLKVVLP